MTADQDHFLHGINQSMELEHFASQLHGKSYRGSTNWTEISRWRDFYIATFEKIQKSAFSSIGLIDPAHRDAIENLIDRAITNIRAASKKDEIHRILIIGLFKLVFLLLGRIPEPSVHRKIDLSTFRTMTYCQTEAQLSALIEQEVINNAKKLGFADSASAHFAFTKWCTTNKKRIEDKSAYVEWVRTTLPTLYAKFR